MRYYAAPMEGLTGYVFRNAHHACFPGTDAYFTPFVSPNRNHEFTSRELKDLLPEHNAGTPVVPQILTNNADDFLWSAHAISDMGYDEVNLNLGCPSPTVVTKGKGSGMLGDTGKLDAFLEKVFSSAPVRISVKTRVGLTDEDSFAELLEVFGRYPIRELIVHPRIQTDMYKKPVRPHMFALAQRSCPLPLIYNGDLFAAGALNALVPSSDSLHGAMFGRGLIANPHLINACQGLSAPDSAIIRRYHDMILEGYEATMPGDRALLFKMRELWHYMSALFPERGSFDKKLKKAAKLSEYRAVTNDLFDTCGADLSAVYHP